MGDNSNILGSRQISGTWGKLWLDGSLIAEVLSFEAKVTANREEVQYGMSKDSKITSLSGEGTIKLGKVYSRGKKKLLEAWKNGEDPRSTITSKLKDPGTLGKQSEATTINNVWFNELALAQFEKGGKIEEELSFGFTPNDADVIDEIEEI
ncbi:TPA: phage tail tube protein [Clostridioides difficile]|uniref:phage tail tube protein n=1 Tax=unclassified Clostridioides TaxID=2635829 RepID=UPI0018C2FADE|nr:terminase [Clostridioides difficile]MCC0641628.1 phage tail tube protein [Clostridioides sp. ES-S-0049-03]MCC0677298.1 phage tail tube protein [Clostridioides sp. ES-W-0018-02]MCC0712447.1 phage tail tube protein [Clostridioides sp. ES-W-0017-02]EGT4910239.1 terminase [Clostridioides difficile]